MSFFSLALRIGHEPRGEWCQCGEPVNDCFFHIVILPARQRWMEHQANLRWARYLSNDPDQEVEH